MAVEGKNSAPLTISKVGARFIVTSYRSPSPIEEQVILAMRTPNLPNSLDAKPWSRRPKFRWVGVLMNLFSPE